MTSRQWITAGIIAILLMIGSLPFSDPSTAAFWLGIGVLIYLVLLKIELKAARLWLCFWGGVAGFFSLLSLVHLLLGIGLLLVMPFVFLVGGGLGFWVTARIAR
jgi:hypothetical protein